MKNSNVSPRWFLSLILALSLGFSVGFAQEEPVDENAVGGEIDPDTGLPVNESDPVGELEDGGDPLDPNDPNLTGEPGEGEHTEGGDPLDPNDPNYTGEPGESEQPGEGEGEHTGGGDPLDPNDPNYTGEPGEGEQPGEGEGEHTGGGDPGIIKLTYEGLPQAARDWIANSPHANANVVEVNLLVNIVHQTNGQPDIGDIDPDTGLPFEPGEDEHHEGPETEESEGEDPAEMLN